MNLYGSLPLPPALYPGDLSLNLVVAAAPGDAQGAVGGLNTTGNRSERIAIARGPWDQTSPFIRLKLVFDGNPGAFNFQIQEATEDSLSEYVTLATGGTITAAVLSPDGISYEATVDLSPFVGNFVLLWCNTQTANNVHLKSAKFSR